MEKKNKHSWVKGPLGMPPHDDIPPHNDGPYTGQPDGYPGDFTNREEMRKHLDDDQEVKMGAPFTDVYGARQYGKCTYCRNPIFMLPTMLFCPWCRRQLTLDAPGYDSSTYEKGIMDSKTVDNGIPNEMFNTPSQNDLRKNLDQYSGGVGNDVQGNKS